MVSVSARKVGKVMTVLKKFVKIIAVTMEFVSRKITVNVTKIFMERIANIKNVNSIANSENAIILQDIVIVKNLMVKKIVV